MKRIMQTAIGGRTIRRMDGLPFWRRVWNSFCDLVWDEGRVIKGAPILFALTVLITCIPIVGITWKVFDWAYSKRIAVLEATNQSNDERVAKLNAQSEPQSSSAQNGDPNGIYQFGTQVGTVEAPQIDEDTSTVFFQRIVGAMDLNNDREFEYGKYVLRIRGELGETRSDLSGQQNRALFAVLCDIVGPSLSDATASTRQPRPPAETSDRDPDGIYQSGKQVGTVEVPQIDEDKSTIFFERIAGAIDLNNDREFEYGEYVLRIRGELGETRSDLSGQQNRALFAVLCDIVSSNPSDATAPTPRPAAESSDRDPDGIYQSGKQVGTVEVPQIDEDKSTIFFERIAGAIDLNNDREFEYGKYVLRIRGELGETRSDLSGQQNRVLFAVLCDIVGPASTGSTPTTKRNQRT
jgi:hypothetical protein